MSDPYNINFVVTGSPRGKDPSIRCRGSVPSFPSYCYILPPRSFPRDDTMVWMRYTFLLFASYALVDAGSQNKGESCSQGNGRLQAGTYQFSGDCNSVTFCAANSTCVAKGCRRDDFPFGYTADAKLPDKCDRGSFCPDEEDECQPWLEVGQPCQLNRDGMHASAEYSYSLSAHNRGPKMNAGRLTTSKN